MEKGSPVERRTCHLLQVLQLLAMVGIALRAVRPVPLPNGAALLPSLEVGVRHDGGDAETGFGLEVGAGLSWNDPQRGITAEVKGRSLLTHVDEEFREQGLALAFAWDPAPSNRGPALAINHTMGSAAEGGMAALLDPVVLEGLDSPAGNGQRFNAELAYGFPVANDRLTLTPALAVALSPDSSAYSLRWSLAPTPIPVAQRPVAAITAPTPSAGPWPLLPPRTRSTLATLRRGPEAGTQHPDSPGLLPQALPLPPLLMS